MDKNAYNCYLINFLGFILVPFTPGTRHFYSGPAESGKIWKGTSMNFDYFFLRRNLCILMHTGSTEKNIYILDKKNLPKMLSQAYPGMSASERKSSRRQRARDSLDTFKSY